MKVIKLAQIPPPIVFAKQTVLEGVRVLKKLRVGAAAVLENAQLVGIFSERDVLLRIVAEVKDPNKTLVSAVMTTIIEKAGSKTECGDALECMVNQHIRHLPVVDHNGSLIGLVSIRNLLQHYVEDLADQLNSLEAYFTADGPGG